MTVLQALARRSSNIENPGVPLTSVNLVSYLGGAPALAGVSVNERVALGLPAFANAVRKSAATLASPPIKVYEKKTKKRVTTPTVLDWPCPRMAPTEFWKSVHIGLYTRGNFYGRLQRDGAGVVRAVWPIHGSRVKVEEVEPTDDNDVGKVFIVDGRDRLTPREVFHLMYWSDDGIVGKGPVEMFRETLGTGAAIRDARARFFGQGMMQSLVIRAKRSLSDEAAAALKRKAMARYGGGSHIGEPMVVDQDTEVSPLSMSMKDAELIASAQLSVTEAAMMIGTPPHIIGDVSGSTSWGSGIEQMTLGWVKFELLERYQSTQELITAALLPGGRTSGSWYAEWDLDGLLQGDSTAQAASFKAGINDGYMSRNEVRRLKNMAPVEGLDDFLVPLNMQVLGADGADSNVPRQLAEIVQKIYLGVGVVLSEEEAREILNQAGADLAPGFTPTGGAA